MRDSLKMISHTEMANTTSTTMNFMKVSFRMGFIMGTVDTTI